MDGPADTTQILLDLTNGDGTAAERLMALVHDDLRSRAAAFMAAERSGHTLQPTALVHEAYIRLIHQERVSWKGRAHFMAVAAEMMRRILVDHARKHQAAKRGGGNSQRVELDDVRFETPDIDLLALDEALDELTRLSERQRRVVEMRFFGALTEVETAEVLGVSPATVRRDWAVARAWLRDRLSV